MMDEMTKDVALKTLAAHRADLSRLKVKSLSIFGSVARDEAKEGSDIDLLVEFSEPVGMFEFLDLKEFLESILKTRVDLATPTALKRQLRDQILKEAIRAA
jgi:predicted nucleotidyltransferase